MSTQVIAKHSIVSMRFVLFAAACLLVIVTGLGLYQELRPGDVDLFTIPNPTQGLKQQQPIPNNIPPQQ